ncbi:hypothetical protein Pcinc_043972 [Petrolisthes cinctipes]|uniref:Gag protein n=1 Tax=Petrolisthes cinctipes TaxID=88211 RepID=A0AAE1BI28_PETCI|nr:hypothetical protein Pcinc_043972 [Petrolisthes cinctipes]
MSLEEDSHRAIARPAGLSGYTPQTYCSVCGKTTVKLPSHPCVSQHCVNSIHTTCLGTETEFDCSKVGSLRIALGITAPVSYLEETTSAPTHSSDTDSSPEDDLAHLLELQPSELVKVIRELRVELSRKNKLIRFYSSVSSNISGVRDAVVGVLDFIDNIAANHSSLGSLNTRTLASSACPDWIDKEWVNHVTTNQDTQDWWTSDNPRPLRSTTTAFPPGPRLACPPDQPVASVPGLDESTQLGPDAPSQTQPDSNTQGQPVSNTHQPGLDVTTQLGPDTPSQTQPDSFTHGQPVSNKHQPGTAVPGLDPPGAASNSVQQRPNLSRHSHSAQLLIGNSGQQRAPKSSRIPFTRNSVNNAQRQVNKNSKINNKKQTPKTFLSAANLPSSETVQFCHHCKRKGHTESTCLRKTRCDYCHRQGHSIQDCHIRLAEERQQQFLHRISTEQAQNNAILVQSLSRLLAPASLHPAVPAPLPQGNWTAQPVLPVQQQPLQTYPGPTQPPYNHPVVWSHASQ